jgi:2-methylcitrate dehydratase
MTKVEELSAFVSAASYEKLSAGAVEALKIRVLDSIACAVGALDGEPVRKVRDLIDLFGEGGRVTLIGGGRAAPDRAAFFNGALVRYLDFNDSYLAPGETCHPSDNIGAVLAAAEFARASGKTFLAALAAAYQVQCRLSDVAPVRARGFDHTTQGAYSVAAGVSRALGLDARRTAHAMAISGAAFNALRVTRTGALSHWKGLAFPNTAFGATHAALLARQGITGPLEVFEGNKGFMDAIAGRFEIDWSREDLERVTATSLKKFNAEIHSQSAIEGILELRDEHHLDAHEVEEITIEIFDVAYHIIGGGEEGNKTEVHTKEEADHSLPYLAAVALLDGQVLPEQYHPGRIRADDVQCLLRKVKVRPRQDLSARFPREMPCRLTVRLAGDKVLVKEKRDYEGYHTRPFKRESVVRKLERLCGPVNGAMLRREIIDTVFRLEEIRTSDLAGLLGKIEAPEPAGEEPSEEHR